MYCGQCGTKLNGHERQCSNCGKDAVQPAKTVTRTMNFKTWGIIAVLVILILIFIPKMFGGGTDMSSPKATVTGFIKAAKKQDIEKMMGFFKPDEDMTKSDIAFFKELYKERMDEQSFKIKDYKILGVDTDKKEATVDYMIKIVYDDELETSEDSFDLVKVGKKWYIDESLFDL
ncbi:Lumazine-binding domain protein [compost metagenome]